MLWVAAGGLAIGGAAAGLVVSRRRRETSEAFAGGDGATHWLGGAVLDHYHAEGGPAGWLGSPLTGLQPTTPDPQTPLAADREARFEHGVLYLNIPSGATRVVAHGN